MNTKTTTNTTAAAPAAAPLASTTSASAFEAARGRGHFGRYGFDGIAQPLPSTQASVKATPGASWMDRFYPDSFRPKSALVKAMLLPVGMVLMINAARRENSDALCEQVESGLFNDNAEYYISPLNSTDPVSSLNGPSLNLSVFDET